MRCFSLFRFFAAALAAGWLAFPVFEASAQDDYQTLKLEAAGYYSERSYKLAYDTWKKAMALGVPDADRRILQFYMADASWRSKPGDDEIGAARESLEQLMEEKPDDPLAAESLESLGDSWLAENQDWPKAWEFYRRALEFWAGSSEIDRARDRYLGIVWKATGPPGDSHRATGLPLEVLSDALEIAVTAEDRARAHFFLGVWYAARGDAFSLRRAGREWEAALVEGSGTAVYEAALYRLAEWNLTAGASEWTQEGGLRLEPDYEKALGLFRRFVKEFPKGSSEYTERALRQIEQIATPSLDLAVGHVWLPGSEPVVHANSRNAGDLSFTLYRVDLSGAFRPNGRTSPEQWIEAVRTDGAAVVREWTEPEPGGRKHAPHRREIALGKIGEAGAYLLVARGGGLTARELVLVTGGAAILKPAGQEAIVFLCDARTGLASPEASATIWRASRKENEWVWETAGAGAPFEKGMARFHFTKTAGGSDGSLLLIGAASGQPLIARSYSNRIYRQAEEEDWRIQVFTDRAAYRPGDEVQWKMLARTVKDGGYATPAGRVLAFKILDPRGDAVDEGKVSLTDFGSAWGGFAVRQDLPLGEYRIEFLADKKVIGSDVVFRLEEYKLPEFKVATSISEGRRRLGDTLPIRVSAEYYFGGGVPDAEVEIVVTESPYFRVEPLGAARDLHFRRTIYPPRGAGKIVMQKKVRTSPKGDAFVELQTPMDSGVDLEYAVEARVVDSSGREVIGRESVVVGRQGYFVDLTPSRRVALPKDTVDFRVEAKDGNDTPAAVDGKVRITRERWTEVWLDPRNREVTGEELDKLERGIFPPPGEPGWRLKSQEYSKEEVFAVDVSTDAEGKGAFTFTPAAEGFYRIAWQSPDGEGPPVVSETNLWVSAAGRSMIEYHAGGIQIIVDPTAPASGGKVPVLLVADTANRDVLFVMEADETVFRAEVAHLDGDAMLIEIEPEARLIPNVFLHAAGVHGLQFYADMKEVEFPPTPYALNVALTPTQETVLPGEEAEVGIMVTDAEGKPVRCELALAVSDEAVSYIQEDYAGNPLDFFYGRKRGSGPPPASSMNWRPYVFETEEMRKQKVVARRDLAQDADGMRFRGELGVFGGSATDAVMSTMGAPVLRSEASSIDQVVVEEEAPVAVRSDFRATAFWMPNLATGADGAATAKFKYPDSLTTWRSVARAATAEASFGFAETATQTTKPLIARLQSPRFLVAGDTATIAGIINNRTDGELSVRADIEAEGLAGSTKAETIRVGANADTRVAWPLKADFAGEARLTLTAKSDKLSDGMSRELPVFENGIDKAVSQSGKAVAKETKFELTIPAERRKDSERMVVTATPSLAAAMLDALPYLIKYPYGCTEQTMSRFLPAAVTARTLQDLGLTREAIANRIFGGIEPEFLSKTHPPDSKTAGIEELDAVIEKGLARLREFQHDDGAWGWWKHDESDPFMTAYVVWGLRLAQQSGVGVREQMLQAGADWLRAHLVDANHDPNLQSWMLHALAALRSSGNGAASSEEKAAIENLWQRRDELAAYGKALFAIGAHAFGDDRKAEVLARNLNDGVQADEQPGVSQATGAGAASPNAVPTAHWGSEGLFYRWQDGGVEATAFALVAMLEIDPKNNLVEPAMNWLVKNRRGAQWSNTRDTAITVIAMNAYLKQTKELAAPVSFDVLVNGTRVAEVRNATALDGQSRFEVDRKLLRDGANEIVLRRTAGEGPLYYSAQAEFFTLEEPIEAAGNEIFVRREYFLTSPRETLLDGYRYDKRPWEADDEAVTNSRVEVLITFDAKNDLEYLVFDDLKPAGLEAVKVQSGESLMAEGPDGQKIPIYCELRDRKVALFIRKLKQGRWTVRYDLRAETPGNFSALPVVGHAMYAPEVRCNSSGRRIRLKAE